MALAITLPMAPAGPVEEALRRLNVRPDRERLLAEWSITIRTMCARDPSTLAAAGQGGRQAQHKLTTPGVAAKQLRQIAATIAKLQTQMSDLGETGVAVLPDDVYE